MHYFDASALAKRYVRETGSQTVRRLLGAGGAATSRLSEVEVASAIARLLEAPGRPVPVPVAGVALRASRPRFAALSNAKLARAGFVMPSWDDALARYVALRAESP